jgi:predicted RNA-binding protein
LSGILLFVLIAIIGYTQTRSFKTYLRNTLLVKSRTALNGQLQIGSIEGNLLTGFTVDSVSIRGYADELLSSERIEFKYDLFGFFFKRIAFNNIVIVKPHIHIYRSVDGTWNVLRLIKPTQKDTTPFAWTIDIKRLKLQDAELVFIDSLLLAQRQIGTYEVPPDSVIDYARVHLSALSLETSAKIQNGRYEVKLGNLEFTSQEPSFALRHFEGDFLLTKNEGSAQNVHIETSKSQVRLDAGIKDVDIASLSSAEELKMKPVDLTVSAEDIDTRELKQFLYPSVDFLDRELKLHLKASGTFGDLKIEKLVIQMPHSFVQLQGRLRNLHSASNLEMTIQSNDNVIAPRDLIDCLPGLKLPDFTFLGPVKYSLSYEGRPLDFHARVSCSTAAGNIDVDGKMKILPEDITYSGTVALHSLALGTLLQDGKTTSSLNARMTIDGTGFDPRSMTGLARIEMDSSLFNGLSVQRSVFVFDIADGMLRSHVAASVGSGTYELSSSLQFLRQDSSNYNIIAKIRSLDLAEVLQDKQYESALSFDLTATGATGKIARSDTVELNFYRSVFGTEKFESGEATAIFAMRDSLQSNLQITSTIGDLDVDGRFSPSSFIAAWDNAYRLVTEAVAYRLQNLDSLRSYKGSIAAEEKFQPSHLGRNVPIESQFHLIVNDFGPIGLFIHIPMSGQGIVEGSIVGDSTALLLQGKVNLEQFGLRAGTDTLNADTAAIQYSFGRMSAQTIFQTFDASVETNLKNFAINAFLFNQLSGQLNVKSDSSDFQFSTFIDSTARVRIGGVSRVNARLMEFEMPELHIEVGQYIADNAGTVRLILGRDGLRIQSLTMVHESEEAMLSGYFSPTGVSDLNISLSGFILSNLKQVLHRGPYAKSSMQFDGKVDAITSFRGSFESPNIIVDLKADGVRAEDVLQDKSQVFGKVESHLAYSEHVLTLLMKFMSRPDDPQASPDLLLSGSLPYEFVLSREAPHKLEGQVDLTLKATRMDLKFLDPFVPEISNLNGMMTCDMRMKGPFDAPQYEGTMSIQQASLVFDPLGIRYVLNGDLIPAGDRIQLERFTIQNDPKELLHVGTMNVTGSFTLLGLNLKHFDIVAQGDLKVMSEDKRFAGQKIYGNLFAATGPNGLHWQGDLSASMVRGDVFIKDAQLVLPPDRDVEFVRASVVNVTFHDDTSRTVPQTSEELKSNNGKTKSLQNGGKVAVGAGFPSPLSEAVHNSFLDGISYDVGIETQGPTTLRFVFNTQTSEELFADLQGRLYFSRIPGTSRLTGQVDVGNRSYYNFIKRFEATGKLLFTGNVLNPELDISATYEGRHDTTNQYQTFGACVGPDKPHQVLVTLRITGTRDEPRTKISLQFRIPPSLEWTDWQCGDEEGNAMAFIFMGQYKNELTDQQRTGAIGANLGSSVGSAIGSGLLTGPASEAIRKNFWGGFQSLDVLYYGGQFGQSADLRVAGQVGEAVIRAGGYVFTGDLGNANVSVELPMSYVIGVERLHHLILTIERRVEGIQNAEEQRRASDGVRLGYRFTF